MISHFRSFAKVIFTLISVSVFWATVDTSIGKAQSLETFSVDSANGGTALNTNNLFRKIDGQPRMSIWQRNDQDPDQQFERVPGIGGTLLKHRSTGKCINAYRRYDGAEFNVWPCNAQDLDQNFTIIPLGDGYHLLQLSGTKFCIDSPTRDNAGKVHLWTCNSNGNQRWKSSSAGVSVGWRLPWPDGRAANVSQGWHGDGYGMNSIDLALPAGTSVIAPVDSKVISQCNAGNNHRAILLEASDGRRYSLIHVTASNISNGKTYRKGEQIGVVASDLPDNGCAVSRGIHLHLGLASKDFSIGGYTLSPTSIPGSMKAGN